jgi:hypothetical protein
MRYQPIALGLLLACCHLAQAQVSASYKLQEHSLNNAGHPAQGVTFSSTNYRITLDALGDAVAMASLASSSYRLDPGFVAAYPPPGEVRNVGFTPLEELGWSAERSAGTYQVYRNTIGSLPGDYGSCVVSSATAPSWLDATTPLAGTGLFYLVTASNRIGERGTKGRSSSGSERGGTVCP